MPDSAGAGAAAARSGASAVLDPEALQRLRELDPTGASKLLTRVVNAFTGSTGRLLSQLQAARAGPDLTAVRHVAHTLKSSSSSVGAVKLSLLCAEMEALAREGRSDGLEDAIAALCLEVPVVLDALKSLLDDNPP